ncbi:GNAT family N-acetyltransferase [Rhodopirellula sp. JC740]|uniref:GNAT family N-acetyltransferase n=1 Tax=Rhodopirellula halodulae TaxID=2894198 RepID=A0ABS8NFN8_9BACT|nr:GNAT family N-acetyltransferase [Rhodopirellula sp. JC740]MCC9641653.1 GNAT family N-acetyltransferase [Rhodopirellula sp. JC740]
MSEYVCEALNEKHNRKDFDCGVDVLNDYLVRFASQDVKRKVAAVFVFTASGEPNRVVGYYTLCATSVELRGLPEEAVKRLPRYPRVPGILIGRLARDVGHPGLGRLLLADALSRSARSAKEIAAAVVVVDAKDKTAADFYSCFGFISLPKMKSRLFLPMATVQRLYSS